MMRQDELLIRLQMLRNDLTADIVIPEIEKLAAASTTSTIDHLRTCARLAMLNQPMPWEKQTKRQRLISALRERLNLNDSMTSDDEILKSTTGTLLRQTIELDFAIRDLEYICKNEISKIFSKIGRPKK